MCEETLAGNPVQRKARGITLAEHQTIIARANYWKLHITTNQTW